MLLCYDQFQQSILISVDSSTYLCLTPVTANFRSSLNSTIVGKNKAWKIFLLEYRSVSHLHEEFNQQNDNEKKKLRRDEQPQQPMKCFNE
jgi:hypothetical protein